MSALDFAQVERAAAGLALKLPRVPHRGKLGEVRASSVGSSMELHDFREYQPGDDVRHLDWNAVARTGNYIVRVRQDEVSPRVEVVLDASASMAVSEAKAARARELALWVCTLAWHGGLEPVLIVAGATARKTSGHEARAVLERVPLDGRDGFDAALGRAPPLLPCGLRVVVSDFLFEATPQPLAERFARGAAGLALVQVLDGDDLSPPGGAGARLIDSESAEVLERILTPDVLEAYQQRFTAHVGLWRAAAQRVRAEFVQLSAEDALTELVRGPLGVLVEVGR